MKENSLPWWNKEEETVDEWKREAEFWRNGYLKLVNLYWNEKSTWQSELEEKKKEIERLSTDNKALLDARNFWFYAWKGLV